ncbi:hypothetical protein C900_00152 [Fulvivirga imtechensis AK7]|uniref:N-acetyltransferase domain-containing protein n=1 Tax=Fulvivirga imtechensis AK7 TaxID=1237149 RepID=L8K0S5_9BACT|nr:GNAT family N-acetyltransferase [Fulvivirga imtechensis]ELR73072.1 hypothetical protein C900_00152 [Fulvivirga imtechensis AK7]
MNISFRKSSISDIDELTKMMRSFNAIDNYPFNENLARENLHKLITNEFLGRLWLIISDGSVAGYIALTFGFSFEYGGRDAFIDELYLKKGFRSKGIGGATIDFVANEAEKLGVKAVHLEVERHNEKGNRLYTRKGFTEHNRILLTREISKDIL